MNEFADIKGIIIINWYGEIKFLGIKNTFEVLDEIGYGAQ